MELAIKDIDFLCDIHNSLEGASVLLLGLASYEDVGPEVKSALNIIADVIETNKETLQRILSIEDTVKN